MAGHSQFKNIMYRKGAQDAKRAKVFSKISREITVAVKEGGADPESNSRLRSALINARAENMPNDNVERAIKKAIGGEASGDYQNVRYEGYGPNGVALIVEGLTDNKNRTASAVRSTFSKFGGSLGDINSVSFMFDRSGYIVYSSDKMSEEELFEVAINAGADDIFAEVEQYIVMTAPEKFIAVRDVLIEKFGDPLEAKTTWIPKTTVPLKEEDSASLMKLISTLEDDDDVQTVIANYELV